VNTPSKLIGLVRFESMLALVLIAVPIALRIADDRDSISAYHDMADPRWFFVPLTAASMMLITNGLVTHERHGHNATLGVLLLGVVMFDHDGASRVPHGISAIAFYVLALSFAVLMVSHYVSVLTSSEPSRRVVGVGAVVVGGALAVVWVTFEPPLFWVEAVGLWLIALHYLFHSFWETRRPHDHTEPADVLERLLPRLHRVIAVLISPLTRLWRWLNTERRAAAAELARETPDESLP
jgi:hypothetical protein